MKTVKIGIIGCGGIANGKHMPSLKKIPGVELVAFCDIIVDRAKKAAADFGVADAKVFEDYTELLKLEDIEVVHVLTPNSSHAPITIAALKAGKHVMCEKPMAISSKEAKAMVAAAKQYDRKLSIGYQNRRRPESSMLKKVCEDGDLGDIYYARALSLRRRGVPTWGVFLDAEKQGGGPLIDIGTHGLDLTLWLMDNYEVDWVVGNVFRKLADRENAANSFGSWDPKQYTVEDSAFGTIRMKNGAMISLESSWALNITTPMEAKVVLCGTEGGADMFDGENVLTINGERNAKLYETRYNLKDSGVAFYEGKSADPSVLEALNWIEHVRGEAELIVKPEQAMVVTQILEAIYESAKQGGKQIFF